MEQLPYSRMHFRGGRGGNHKSFLRLCGSGQTNLAPRLVLPPQTLPRSQPLNLVPGSRPPHGFPGHASLLRLLLLSSPLRPSGSRAGGFPHGLPQRNGRSITHCAEPSQGCKRCNPTKRSSARPLNDDDTTSSFGNPRRGAGHSHRRSEWCPCQPHCVLDATHRDLFTTLPGLVTRMANPYSC